MKVLSAQNLEKVYVKKPIVNDVSIEVEQGEVFFLDTLNKLFELFGQILAGPAVGKAERHDRKELHLLSLVV